MSIQLKNLYICETAVIAFNGQLSVINLTSEIVSSSFPALCPKLSVVVNVIGDISTYRETIEIVDLNSSEVIAKIDGETEIKNGGENNFVGNFLNTVFPREGKYWIKVSINRDNVITEQINHNHCIEVKKSK
ncbi:MAG: hypothetical protein JWP09_885 [Candidatus Taylorbacteria bacterium]|nr:hypothetical protein [Candidatus Taylorbacteria bacterium]